MKKIAKKLLFSSLALGASVLTLTTTTYAWYVQNNTATATNVTASTKDEVGNSLFISKNNSTWGNTVEFLSTATPNGDFPNNSNDSNFKGAFVPMSYDNESGTKGFRYANDNLVAGVHLNTGGNDQVETFDGGRLQVSMWLMCTNSDNVSVRPTLRLQNTTGEGDVYAQKAYAAVNSTTETPLVAQNATFWTDAAQALRMSITTKVGDADAATKYYDVMEVGKQMAKDGNGAYVAYEAINCPKAGVNTVKEEQLGTYSFDSGNTVLTGAHGYYRTLVGAAPVYGFVDKNTHLEETVKVSNIVDVTNARTDGDAQNPKTTGEAGGMDYITVGTNAVKVTFTIWLEGTDVSCFDCCAKQAFNFAFDFDIVA